MILASLTIENYKQFAGKHEIAFPSTGIIGILGANGAGKTTLFEAIEWCLYNPRSIENVEVVPRGTAARTRVRVTLEDPYEGARYVVERSLRAGKTSSAELFREDDAENRITQGPREVTRYVASRLIGLDHAAFVSTFFTRQKELSFFGNVAATDRRVAVAKLLGYETIREAQRLLGHQRTKARNAADALRAQHHEESAERDFAAEVAAAAEAVNRTERALIAVHATVETATAALATAAKGAERWRDMERRDAGLHAQLNRVEGTIQTGEARRDHATAALNDLDRQAAQRQRLGPLALLLEERQGSLDSHEADRAKHERAERLKQTIQHAEGGQRRAAGATERAVLAADADAIDKWSWRGDDAIDPLVAIVRLRQVADGLDHEGARAEVRTSERLIELSRQDEEKRARHRRCLETLKTLHAEIDAITSGISPEDEIRAARHRREGAVVTATTVEAEISGLAANRKRLENLAGTLARTRFDAPESVCPTCQRPFSADDAEATIATLRQTIAGLKQDEARVRDRERAARATADDATRQIAAAEARRTRLSEARDRLGKGQGVTIEAERAASVAEDLLAATIAESNRTSVPTPAELTTSQQHLARIERVARAAESLRQAESEARQHAEDRCRAAEALATLGEIAYDTARHQLARQDVEEARNAATRIQEIDTHLARRPELEASLAVANEELSLARAEHARVVAERTTLGFLRASLEAALAAEHAARTAERESLDRLADTRTAVADATSHRQRIADEQERVENLARRADTLVREQETLNQVYDEFTAFDRYVANRVTPYLAEQTGELLATVTDGRYDQVQFDTDYGLRVFDGPLDSFPITAFSGGERDVVALCARLALSRVVGAQAANPPSFLVLDEVFGALDQERRAQVLQTLGVLSGTAEAYRQLFIISHVDDIRQSPIFDEVWRIREGPEGSQVERADQLGGLEEA